MNKSIKLLFIISVSFILFSSLAYEADAWSLFGWIKERFSKKNVQQVQAQPIQNNQQVQKQNIQKPKTVYDIQFPTSSLKTLNDKCVIYDRILNYCGSLSNWNSYSNPDYYLNNVGNIINGNSMIPLLKQGDSLAIRKYNGEKLYSCEIVRAKMPSSYNVEYGYHRIIGFTKERKIVLRGDNNPKTMYEIIDKKDITNILCGKL